MKRGLRPSEWKRLQALGYTREQAEEYVYSGFTDVEDWLQAKNLGLTDVKVYDAFKKSGFPDYQEYRRANNAGFDTYTEWQEACKGNFPTRADLILAKEKGFDNWEAYQQSQHPISGSSSAHIAPPISLSSEPGLPTQDADEPAAEFASSSLKNNKLEEFGQSDTFLSTPSEKSFNTSVTGPESQQIVRPTPPIIDPKKFFDNPEFERVYRLVEVLYETSEATLEDFTAALAFEDALEMEDWLREHFDTSQYTIRYHENKVSFQLTAYFKALESLTRFL